MMVFLTVAEIVVLIAGLAFFLYWTGTLLTNIAKNLEECARLVKTIRDQAVDIVPGVEHINRTGKVVASALPLLYGFAERIVSRLVPTPTREPARPASGTRRSRLHETVGYRSPK
jgi:hypothetical protein